ncbi:MAG: YtxH domain-containing protein, partial [Nitrospiria bacterium]
MQDYSDMGKGSLMTGAVLGAIGAFLLAPQTGRQTRRWLAEYANVGGEKLKEAGEGAGRYFSRSNGSRYQEEDGAGRTAFALTGALVGVVAALMFAPQSGNETRQWLADQAKRGQEKVKEGAEQLKHYAQEGSQ